MDLVALRAELIRDEGRVGHAYRDSRGYLTIGVGHMVDERLGGQLDDNVIDLQLDNDIARCMLQMNGHFAWFSDLDDVRQLALLNMCFQLGIDGLSAFTTMLGFMAQGDYEAAADDAATTLWARQTPDRALRVISMIRTGVA